MLRDLLIGGLLGTALWGWRAYRLTIRSAGNESVEGSTVSQNDVSQNENCSSSQIQTLQRQLVQAQKELAIAVAKRAEAETQVSELNQLATDRAIELIQLQADSAELLAQVAQLSQKRPRKKRAPKVEASSLPSELPSEQPSELALQEPILEPVPSSEPLDLDLSLIHQKQAETAVASQLLQTVFTETASPESERAVSAQNPVIATTGLDSAHSAFLKVLSQQSSWNRQDLLAIAQEHGLMPDGALEVINDAALDQCDEPLTEGDDPVMLDPNVLRELLS
jgi:TerB-C domain